MSAGVARFHSDRRQLRIVPALPLYFSIHTVGMAVLLGIGTTMMMLLGQRGDIATTAITRMVKILIRHECQPLRALIAVTSCGSSSRNGRPRKRRSTVIGL
jgi:hypothetical protein